MLIKATLLWCLVAVSCSLTDSGSALAATTAASTQPAALGSVVQGILGLSGRSNNVTGLISIVLVEFAKDPQRAEGEIEKLVAALNEGTDAVLVGHELHSDFHVDDEFNGTREKDRSTDVTTTSASSVCTSSSEPGPLNPVRPRMRAHSPGPR